MITETHISIFEAWQADWNKFASEFLKVKLDKEQQDILTAIQKNKMVSVRSGTARGKDFVAAVAAMCFMYLTPEFNENGEMTKNTKIVMTAPTGRQVNDIMYPEITKLFNAAKVLPGRLVGCDIRTDFDEWFLTGFKADEHNQEAWTGYHAVNIMFIVTEASGIPEKIFESIEGNLQGNSRLLLVFNPNTPIGYAAQSQKSERFVKFRLNSLTSPNVLAKEIVIPGQVDYAWVCDKVNKWCGKIRKEDFNEAEGDFEFEIDGEKGYYRPNDIFRVKVLGMFPRVSEDSLIPLEWIEIANERWKEMQKTISLDKHKLRIGNDVAGMGNDDTVFCYRYENFVEKFEVWKTSGTAEHMAIVGKLVESLRLYEKPIALIDTIGEGAGVFSRLKELGYNNAISAKVSEGANGLTDFTEVRKFTNMRAYVFWAIRDWLDPKNKQNAALPYDDELTQELTEIRYEIKSDGKIAIEPKEDLKQRLKRSPGKADALSLTFYPNKTNSNINEILNAFKI